MFFVSVLNQTKLEMINSDHLFLFICFLFSSPRTKLSDFSNLFESKNSCKSRLFLFKIFYEHWNLRDENTSLKNIKVSKLQSTSICFFFLLYINLACLGVSNKRLNLSGPNFVWDLITWILRFCQYSRNCDFQSQFD